MIHPTAIVETDIDESTNVWAYAHVMRGAEIGRQVNIGDHSFIEGGAVIGDRVTVKNGVTIWKGITIDCDVFIGPRVTFTNDRYPRSPRAEGLAVHYADESNWLVTTQVQRGCSIGAAATICPGVSLGVFSMIGAAAVVTRDVPAFGLVVGAPGRQAGWVCSCGYPLAGTLEDSDCTRCGISAEQRLRLATADSH